MIKTKKANSQEILNELKALKDETCAKNRSKFFQTHKGGYGEGDLFLGLTVPQQRKAAGKYYRDITVKETEKLLRNKFHEARYVALAILIEKYKKKKISDKEKKEIAGAYLRNSKYINNWDLVDISAPHIIGEYWFNNSPQNLWKYAKSKNLWQERISVLATLYFIRRDVFDKTLELAVFFLKHEHDLMHKAVGWMLREAGKRSADVLYKFLDKYRKVMPRTMLRYAIEKLPERKRKHYMEK
ncbi:MAG: DNA alkylation repair protein [Endomicrobia bacterium]|nr:DNA alkylation repair protein [Bacillota bacterium]MCL1973020.1 DNA alkylation repair protein [Endomicrobiia bacterium]